MKSETSKARALIKNNFRILDLFIVVIFLSIAAFSLNLFWLDLMRTINLQNVEPVGTVVVRKNTVQRRHSNRVLWDRLSYESPVYIGDLIRVAEVSAATLNIESNSIELDENTLVRITRSGDSLQISLREGTLSLVTGSAGGVIVDINGKQVQTAPGTVLSAASGANGRVSVQVNRGSARFVGEGAGREITSGMIVAMDAAGNELFQRTVVVTSPSPNARYLKNTDAPFAVNFSWNRINLDPSQTLRLDIAMDRNFSQIFRIVENLDNQAQVLLGSGLWFWRLSFENTVLAWGNFTIADGADIELDSPAMNSRYSSNSDINFQWEGTEDAVSYIVEISDSPDFAPVRYSLESTAPFLSHSGFGEGLWYWRVMPVFPPVYEGTAVYSNPSSFRVENTDAPLGETSWAQWLESLSAGGLFSGIATRETNAALDNLSLVNLISPADGAGIPGLTALRGQADFRWETSEEIRSSRFVISSNPNPLQDRSAVVIPNPGRTFRFDRRLGAGTWYWTVEVQTADGLTVSAPPRRVVVQTIPRLPAPGGMSPERNARLDYDYFASNNSITFRWNAVPGANAYIFTLYQTSARSNPIARSTESGTSFTLTDFSRLDIGTFVWQVEAVNMRGGAVEQNGAAGESVFVIDFPLPRPVQIEDTGILYGN